MKTLIGHVWPLDRPRLLLAFVALQADAVAAELIADEEAEKAARQAKEGIQQRKRAAQSTSKKGQQEVTLEQEEQVLVLVHLARMLPAIACPH